MGERWMRGVVMGIALGALAAGCSQEGGGGAADTGVDASALDGGASDAGDALVRPDTGGCAVSRDGDGDGHDAIACGGDDCDDADATRFPGRQETCDPSDHDEDCDPSTFGVRDGDGDGFADARCCNVSEAGARTCGTDCDDTRITASPTTVEVCNGLDDDCDAALDEGVTVTFWPDADDDNHGVHDPSMTRMGCPSLAPAHYAEHDDACDDTRAYVHPGLPESCDLAVDGASHDENCDGSVDEGCDCVGSSTRECPGAVGACATGLQTCVAGRFSACSVLPSTDVCNMADDDCDGSIDEGTTVLCYPDADEDTYTAMGSTGTTSCQANDRPTVGGCPTGSTNRAPVVGAIDCGPMNGRVSPDGMEGMVCDGLDQDCDGVLDDGLTFTCYLDNDDDGYALLDTGALQVCPDPARGIRGFCPFRMTDRMPTGALNIDCNDTTGMLGASTFPMAAEVCDGQDNDCDTRIDESTMVTCYGDADNDTYAPAGASASSVCRVVGRDGAGGCPLGSTFRAPASALDCDDANPLRYAGAIEQCNSSDDDCDTRVDEGASVLCYVDTDNDSYAASGASASMLCADASRPLVGGCPVNTTNRAPTGGAANVDCRESDALSYPGASEACDTLDNDCDAAIDEGTVRQTCYRDMDNDNAAALGATSSLQCPDPSRSGYGNCPPGYTGNAPIPTAYDCADADPSRHWPTITCWPDDDGDGFACPTSDTGSYDCHRAGGGMTSAPIAQCPIAAGACNALTTATNPGASPGATSDCNDAAGAQHTWGSCFSDGDTDGYYGTSVGGYHCAAGGAGATSCPSGTSPTTDDCCDSDARAHPGGTAQTTARACGGAGGYDFDCDGVSTRTSTGVSSLVCSYVPGEGCTQGGAPGWQGSAPACGVAGTYRPDCGAPTGCPVLSESRTQSCR